MAARRERMRRMAFGLLVCGLVLAADAVAQVADGSEFNVDSAGVAIDGYDPVAYFTLGEPTEGSPELRAEYNGVTFLFANEEHRDLFLEDPERYLPQYGGWCAWAASEGYLAEIDPEAFVVHEDRLFLNYNRRLNRRFSRNLEENIGNADGNWPELSREASER